MSRFSAVLAIAMMMAGVAVCQEPGGMSPKAGAYSDGLYTNLFFGFNFKVPQKWTVSWVAQSGSCDQECMLLDVRNPKYPKPMEMIQITAEASKSQATLHEASAAQFLTQAGAKKVAEPKELLVNGLTFYRTDYRSSLANGELFQSMVVMPGKAYATVFTFASTNRRALDDMIADFGSAFSKLGAK